MKNVMDYFEYLSGDDPPYLSGKVAALISTSGGGASVSAINITDQICRTLHAWVCPTSIVIPLSSEKFDSQGNLTDGKIRNRLLHMTDELEFAVTRFHK
jgi:NAD(P)H-dependent FMN reductase